MTTPTTAPYGKWASPITADLIAKKSTSVIDVLVDSHSSALYHVESRPSEAGRNAIVDSRTQQDVFGPGWNARTGVHEYGGTCAVVHDGVVFFSHFADERVYKIKEGSGEEPVAVTPENAVHRFAELTPHPTHPHLFLAILEDHTNPAPSDVVTTLVIVDTNALTVNPFASGADFYSSGTFNPSGTRVAWVQWFHPDMPWEGAELVVADVEFKSGALIHKNARKIAGERLNISVTRPQWVDDDVLIFTSDETGWINPYIFSLSSGFDAAPSPLLKQALQEDFGAPAWALGDAFFAILDKKTTVFSALRDGRSVLYKIDLDNRKVTELTCPFVYISRVRRLSANQIAFLGERTDQPLALVIGTISETSVVDCEVLRPNSEDESSSNLQPFFSSPQPLTFVNKEHGNEPLHVVFYPPHNPNFVAPAGEKPPCVVYVHGGPTGLTTQGLHLRKQYFTSRGWAWVDVNYGGSSGYGRKYVGRLVGKWGIVDVSDCVQAVVHLATSSANLPISIDPARVVITGGSAGGFTVLAALCAYPSTFAAGTSSYGVSDLRKLAEDTHKFESRYLEKLVGGTPEEVPEIYEERSPVFNAGNIRSPLLILQGSIDKVVPPAQAEEMMKVIKANGGRVEYVLFEGEGHGWRKGENIITALEKELAFYNDVFGL